MDLDLDEGKGGEVTRLFQFFQAKIPISYPHGRTDMHLYTKETSEPSVDGVIIRYITHQDLIDKVLHMIAFYYDPV